MVISIVVLPRFSGPGILRELSPSLHNGGVWVCTLGTPEFDSIFRLLMSLALFFSGYHIALYCSEQKEVLVVSLSSKVLSCYYSPSRVVGTLRFQIGIKAYLLPLRG